MIQGHRVQLGRVCLTLLCVMVLSCVSGCKLIKASDSVELTGSDSLPATIDSVSTRGLEVRLMVVDDTGWDAARALLPFGVDYSASSENRSSEEEAAFEQWADWGFRFVRVPIGDVQGVLDLLRPVQPSSNQWLGEFGQWRAIVRAGELGTSRVRVGDYSATIERGRPCLVARSWIEPMLTKTDVIPAVRLDLAIQIQTKKRPKASLGFQVNRTPMIEDQGPILDELLYSFMLDGSHALVLVGEVPGFDWNELPEPVASVVIADQGKEIFGPGEGAGQRDVAQGQEPDEKNSNNAGGPDSGFGPGPQQPDGQSLGELMLTSAGSRVEQFNKARIVPKRVIVVLIPRVVGGYGLIPRVAHSAGGAP